MEGWFARTDLNLLLGLQNLTESRLLSGMDFLEQSDAQGLQRAIFRSVQEHYRLENSGVIYDVTNTYLYGKHCEMGKLGRHFVLDQDRLRLIGLSENALSDAVRFFHIDALSSAVGMKVDFDMALLVLASGLYRPIAQRMHGYADAQARQIFRDLIDMPADVTVGETEIAVSFHRRAHLPILLASDLMESVPQCPGGMDYHYA
jgi:hypothetical protein